MKIIQLPDVLHEYLVHVLERHAANGIHPEEGLALNRLWEATVKNVTHVDDAAIAKAAAAGTPAGQSPVEDGRDYRQVHGDAATIVDIATTVQG